MQIPDEDTRLSACLRVTRFVIILLTAGVLLFGVNSVANNPAPAEAGFISYLALAFAAFDVLLQAVLPGLMATNLRRQLAAGKWPAPRDGASVPPDDLGKLLSLFQVRLLVGAGLLEGGACFLLIAYQMDGAMLALAAAGVMLALLLVKFPTRPGLEAWLSDQQELLRQDRMAA